MLDWEEASAESYQIAQEEWERYVTLPNGLPGQLADNEVPAYYIIWRRDGSIFRQYRTPYDNPVRPADHELTMVRRSFGTREAGPLREVFLKGPSDTLICVGRGVRGELRRFWELGISLTVPASSSW